MGVKECVTTESSDLRGRFLGCPRDLQSVATHLLIKLHVEGVVNKVGVASKIFARTTCAHIENPNSTFAPVLIC